MRMDGEFESVELIRRHLAAEIERAREELPAGRWEAILVGVSDYGRIAAYPSRLILPFHYPKTDAELHEYGPDHFEFPEDVWELRWEEIPEFVAQYEVFAALKDDRDSNHASERHRRRRIAVLRGACALFDPDLAVFGVESDNEEWWEVNTFHVAGPHLPSPPSPVSDVQLLARLCCQTGRSARNALKFEDGAVVEVFSTGRIRRMRRSICCGSHRK